MEKQSGKSNKCTKPGKNFLFWLNKHIVSQSYWRNYYVAELLSNWTESLWDGWAQPTEVMKSRIVLSKPNSILTNIPNYLQRRRKGRLYQQWIERAGLPPEAIPREEVPEDITTEKVNKELLRPLILYIFLELSLIILCVGLALLIMQSC